MFVLLMFLPHIYPEFIEKAVYFIVLGSVYAAYAWTCIVYISIYQYQQKKIAFKYFTNYICFRR